MSKRLGGIIGCKDKTSSWHFIGFPDGSSNIGSTVSYRENPPLHYLYTVHQYFQHAHFIPIVGVGKRGAYYLAHGDLPRQQPFGTTSRFTGPVPADSRQWTPSGPANAIAGPDELGTDSMAYGGLNR